MGDCKRSLSQRVVRQINERSSGSLRDVKAALHMLTLMLMRGLLQLTNSCCALLSFCMCLIRRQSRRIQHIVVWTRRLGRWGEAKLVWVRVRECVRAWLCLLIARNWRGEEQATQLSVVVCLFFVIHYLSICQFVIVFIPYKIVDKVY